MKKLTTDKSIYLVGRVEPYEGYDVLAAFKTIESANNFISECVKLLKKNKQVPFGQYTLDKYDIKKLEVIKSWYFKNEEFPYFDK